jgi:hypothetical protein
MIPRILAAPALILLACNNDQGLKEIKVNQVAVVTGDFDEVEESLVRHVVRHDLYEGYISAPVYNEEVDPATMTLKSEALFSQLNDRGDTVLFDYDALFVNSGTRGLGAYVYNDVVADDALLMDPTALEHVREYVEAGHVLVVSDWAYDLVEAIWPDAITFHREAEGYDAAQMGLSDEVIADVVDGKLAESLENDQLAVAYDFSYWTVVESAGSGTRTHLSGTVNFRGSDGEGELQLHEVPLLLSFPAGSGKVVFSSFSWRAQNRSAADLMLGHLVEGLGVLEETPGASEQVE